MYYIFTYRLYNYVCINQYQIKTMIGIYVFCCCLFICNLFVFRMFRCSGTAWTADFGLPAAASLVYAALVRNAFAVSSHPQTWRVRQDKDHLM